MASTAVTPLGLEGPLSKWTNVMKGWQYRWFVLDHQTGLLSYYTSKDKMKRGSRQGCVRLKGAVIGIDDEDDSTFTITVDQKTFHFQAQNEEERSKWVEFLQETIIRHKQPSKYGAKKRVSSEKDIEQKILEADAYLQILIDQVDSLVQRAEKLDQGHEKNQVISIKNNANAMIESIKQGIVMLQIAKNVSHAVNGVPEAAVRETVAVPSSSEAPQRDYVPPDNYAPLVSALQNGASSPVRIVAAMSTEDVPIRSYSSSEDEWEDAEESLEQKELIPLRQLDGDEGKYADDSDEDPLDCEKHGSVITHLLSQVRLGMDLTKVVLPTFILEKRSLLEMYADFFAHPEFFARISDLNDPRDRMMMVVKWYLSSFHAGRKGSVAKKPYNPLLGETFRCLWDLEENTEKQGELSDGPVPWARTDQVCFLAEQVSHHPPISAFYAECPDTSMEFNAHIWTKSKFLGLSIGVEMVGQACVSDLKHEEEYIATFPNGYGRSILTVPWFEMGGKCNINCAKTGYCANINFLTKPFYGGRVNRISAEVFHVTDKKPFVTLEGEWTGSIIAKYPNGDTEVFVDTKALNINKKRVKPVDHQDEYESRRLWKHVTNALKEKNVEKATEHKHFLEDRQRNEARERKEAGATYIQKHFEEDGECWVYSIPLQKRLQEKQKEVEPPQDPSSTDTTSPQMSIPSVPDQLVTSGLSISQPVSPDHRRSANELDQSSNRKALSQPNLLDPKEDSILTSHIPSAEDVSRTAAQEVQDLLG